MATQDEPSKDLLSVHDDLVQLNKKLLASLSKSKDPALSDAIVTEMREVVHRIDLVQKLIFTEQANDISSAAKQIDKANALAVNSLNQIKNVTDLVNTVTSVLALVDEAIDLAKVLALA
jgi:hypothetical protein